MNGRKFITLSTVSLINLVRRHVVLILMCVLLGGAAATSVVTFLITPSYLVTTKLYVSGAGTDADERLKNGEYARTHVSSYTDMIDSNDLLQAVREKMGLRRARKADIRIWRTASLRRTRWKRW